MGLPFVGWANLSPLTILFLKKEISSCTSTFFKNAEIILFSFPE